MTDEDKKMRELLERNPLARELVKIAQDGISGMVEDLTKDGARVWVNGVECVPKKKQS